MRAATPHAEIAPSTPSSSAGPASPPRPGAGEAPVPRVTCFIRYELDPFQREAFAEYARAWSRIIPRCGGHLVGYFLPHEGSNCEAWGLIAFESLAAYEAYRTRLKADGKARANFEFAQRARFIVREERRFCEVVPEAFQQPAR